MRACSGGSKWPRGRMTHGQEDFKGSPRGLQLGGADRGVGARGRRTGKVQRLGLVGLEKGKEGPQALMKCLWFARYPSCCLESL